MEQGRPRRPPSLAELRHWVADRLAPQIDAYTWHRYALIEPHLLTGAIRTLNIGTGGGIETLRPLDRGNFVTTIEYDADTAGRTRQRIVRAGYGDRHIGLRGHVLKVELDETFDQVMICECLEHILDDTGTVARLAQWLKPGGRLILSTPTARYGQLPGDTLSAVEDGGHVRAGYDGPELDEMLRRSGLLTIKRIPNSGVGPMVQHLVERRLRRTALPAVGMAFGLASRSWMGALDLVPVRATDQITIAVRVSGAAPGGAN